MAPLGLLPLATMALAAYFGYQCLFRHRTYGRLPPGPRPLPLLGNMLDFPPTDVPEYQHWLKHKDRYGPITSVSAFGMTLVIIHDKGAAHHILDETSVKTSGRPTMIFANEMCGFGQFLICQTYNNTLRRWRRLLHQEIGSKTSVSQFRDSQVAEVRRQLVRALHEPEKWHEHCKTTMIASVIRMAYGYSIAYDKHDELVDMNKRMIDNFLRAAAPMTWLPDIFPVLRHLPEGFPGTTFQKTAREWRDEFYRVAYTPFHLVQSQITAHIEQPSFVSKLIRKLRKDPDNASTLNQQDEDDIVWTALSLYNAALDTSIITMSAFTLAMVLNPSVQKRAQEEIDSVIGHDRLPDFDDWDRLPYTNALFKETLRWWPAVPLGFPHAADEDVEYNDICIPKGAILIPAIWWFLHDPEVYVNPGVFDPERFLPPRNEPDPVDAFGYGRRVCPGRLFAETSIFINIVHSLAVFDFKRAVDADGKDVDINVTMTPGMLAFISHFDFQVVPRSPHHVEVINRLDAENQ